MYSVPYRTRSDLLQVHELMSGLHSNRPTSEYVRFHLIQSLQPKTIDFSLCYLSTEIINKKLRS